MTRLSALLREEESLSDLEVSESVKQDMAQFVSLLSLEIESIPQNSDLILSKKRFLTFYEAF